MSLPFRLTLCWRVLVALAFGIGLVAPFGCESGSAGSGFWSRRKPPEPLPEIQVKFDHIYGGSSDHHVGLQAAINECLTLDFSLQSDQPIEAINVAVSDWTSDSDRLASSITTIYQAHPVKIDQHPIWQVQMIPKADRPESAKDVLVPVNAPYGGLPTFLSPATPLHITLDICIPPDAAPENYESRLMITSNDREPKTIPIKLEIWPIVLPITPKPIFLTEIDYHDWLAANCPDARSQSPAPIPTIAWADDQVREKMKTATTTAVAILSDHGIAVTFDGLTPSMKTDARMNVHPVWPPYDQVLETIDTAAGPLARFNIPFDGTHLSPDNATSKNRIKSFFTECQTHFADKKWLDRTYLQLKKSPGIIHDIDRRIPIVASMSAVDCRTTDTPLQQHLPAIAPRLTAIELPARWCASQSNASKVPEWAKIDRPPYSGTTNISGTPSDIRVLAWQTASENTSLITLDNIINWPRDAQSATPQTCLDHTPSTLIYPGHSFGLSDPIPSRRLKNLRRATQDHAYIQLLKKYNQEEFLHALTNSLVPYAFSNARRYSDTDPMPIPWPRNEKTWEQARLLMAEKIVQITRPRLNDPDQHDRLQQQANRLLAQHHRIEMHVEGVRILPERNSDQFRVDMWIRIDNLTPQRIAGKVWIDALPPGWSRIEPQTPVPTIEPRQAKIVSITARADASSHSTSQPFTLPIHANLGTHHRLQTSARITAITPLPVSTPITIDGDTTDWPTNETNIATDFKSITAQPDESIPPVKCILTQDTEHLYIAAKCPAATNLTTTGNALPYEDGMPINATRFEILIDPNNAGTHDPNDLLHIAIGHNGSIFEKGVDLTNTGQRRIWPADIRYATSSTDDSWIIEMRIPKASISQTHDIDRVWGLNFAYFDATTQTFQTWSGARFNAYDPMSLGNLIWSD